MGASNERERGDDGTLTDDADSDENELLVVAEAASNASGDGDADENDELREDASCICGVNATVSSSDIQSSPAVTNCDWFSEIDLRFVRFDGTRCSGAPAAGAASDIDDVDDDNDDDDDDDDDDDEEDEEDDEDEDTGVDVGR